MIKLLLVNFELLSTKMLLHLTLCTFSVVYRLKNDMICNSESLISKLVQIMAPTL